MIRLLKGILVKVLRICESLEERERIKISEKE